MLVCLLACLLSLLVAGCGSSGSSKTIKSASDLTGKIVGVQEGTTGDLDITDDKDIKVKSVERRARSTRSSSMTSRRRPSSIR